MDGTVPPVPSRRLRNLAVSTTAVSVRGRPQLIQHAERAGLAAIIAKKGIGSYRSPGLSARVKVPSLHQNLKPAPAARKVITEKRPVKKKKKGEYSCSDEEKVSPDYPSRGAGSSAVPLCLTRWMIFLPALVRDERRRRVGLGRSCEVAQEADQDRQRSSRRHGRRFRLGSQTSSHLSLSSFLSASVHDALRFSRV